MLTTARFKLTIWHIVLLAALLALLGFVLLSTMHSSRAHAANGNGNFTGATVTHNFPCGIVVPTGGFVTTTDSNDVVTPSNIENLTCHATTTNPTGKAASITNGACFGFKGELANVAHIVESASGQLSLTCPFHH